MFRNQKIISLLFSLALFGCSTNSNGKILSKAPQVEIRPGEARRVVFDKNGMSEKAELVCRDNKYKFYSEGDKYIAYVAESYFSDMSGFKCLLKEARKEVVAVEFKVDKKQFPEEKLKVDGRKINLRKKDLLRVAKEQEVLNNIYASSVSTPYFQTAFKVPLNSYVTSIYGIRRTYNKQHKGQHLGTDFRAPVGEKIPAANRGKVVFSGDLFYTGWTVIIDHGLDIFTVYGHLSKTLVESGQIVQRGDLIGLAGSTGRSSGPHLHWGVKIHGQYIDGIDLAEQTKKQFKE